MHITLNVLADNELFYVDTCDEGHNIKKKNTKTICLELYKCSFK